MMSPLAPWRREIRGLIPRGFLRRDQGDGLFISDYPRYENAGEVTARLESSGFAVAAAGGLARIDGTKEKYAALISSLPRFSPAPTDETLPLYGLAQRIVRGGGATGDHLFALRLTMKYLDAGDETGLLRALSPLCAQAQRQRAPLPAAVGQLILNALWDDH